QCVHKVAAHPSVPDRLFAQSHNGVSRSADARGSWTSIAEGLPSDVEFPIAVPPHRPETAGPFPLVADADRMPRGGRARVWRSDDAGGSWRESGHGLPDDFYAAVMRDAMTSDGAEPAGLYVGARDGSVFASTDEGDSWTQVAAHLPD